MKFLDAFSPTWNISLFHYRAQVCIVSDIQIFYVCCLHYVQCTILFLLTNIVCLPLYDPQKGESGANVLVGFQIPISEMKEFQSRANELGYGYMEETSNYAFQLLMR